MSGDVLFTEVVDMLGEELVDDSTQHDIAQKRQREGPIVGHCRTACMVDSRVRTE